MCRRAVPRQLDQVLPRFAIQEARSDHSVSRIPNSHFGKRFVRVPAESGYIIEAKIGDLATSQAEIDVLLCAECRYFVGTNSGYSVLPPVFGKRCALTNWSPIGIPNWYLDDIYIPKLVRRRRNNKYLTFTELFSSFAGWSQFQRDFANTGLVVEDNEPADLLAAVQELHGEITGVADEITNDDEVRLRRFTEIALAHGGYVGSRMSYRFLRKYPQLLE